MFSAFQALGLFLEPSRIQQKTEEFIAQAESEEKVVRGPVESARHIYRILMRLALARGSPQVLRTYAQKEDHFSEAKVYQPFVDRPERAVEIARKYYERS